MKKILFVCYILLMAGCSGESDVLEPQPKPDDDQLSLTSRDIVSPYRSGKEEFRVNTNRDWEAVSSADWLTISPTSGSGPSDVTISWSDNLTLEDRKATVTVKAGKQEATVSVSQKHKSDSAHMVSCRAILGNLVKYEKDSIEIVFDKPVKVLESSIINDAYVITDNPMVYDNGTRYQWSFPAGKAGMDIDLALTIQSQSDLTTIKKSFKIPFYEKKYVINAEEVGSIRGSCLSFDKKSLWLTLQSGYRENNKLIQLSLDDFSVMKTIDLPFAPKGLCLNPYNGLLYVLPYIKNLYLGYADYLYVVNPESGEHVKTIQIEQSPYAHPQYPTNYPSSLAFTRDGFGILVLMAAASTELEWRYIDSADNDKITLGSKNDMSHEITTVHRNYDSSRIYATPGNYFTTINWFDRQHKTPVKLKLDGKFNSTEYYAGGTMATFVMSPYANKAFISASPGSHCVVNLDPVDYSKVIIEESRDSRSVWDGLVSDRDYVYQVCGYSYMLELFDMTKGEIIYATNHTFILGTDQDLVACHFLPDTDQLLVTTLTSVTLLDAAEMKRRSVK